MGKYGGHTAAVRTSPAKMLDHVKKNQKNSVYPVQVI